jgi:hypothetical protein
MKKEINGKRKEKKKKERRKKQNLSIVIAHFSN